MLDVKEGERESREVGRNEKLCVNLVISFFLWMLDVKKREREREREREFNVMFVLYFFICALLEWG